MKDFKKIIIINDLPNEVSSTRHLLKNLKSKELLKHQRKIGTINLFLSIIATLLYIFFVMLKLNGGWSMIFLIVFLGWIGFSAGLIAGSADTKANYTIISTELKELIDNEKIFIPHDELHYLIQNGLI